MLRSFFWEKMTLVFRRKNFRMKTWMANKSGFPSAPQADRGLNWQIWIFIGGTRVFCERIFLRPWTWAENGVGEIKGNVERLLIFLNIYDLLFIRRNWDLLQFADWMYAIRRLPPPPPQDRTAVKAYHQSRSRQLRQTSAELQPPEFSDFPGSE